jgi:hypothetical protein
MKDHFTLTIPTKPYLAKYLYTLYGQPIVFTTTNYFGTTLLGYITTRIYLQNQAHVTHRKFDEFNTPLYVLLPFHWLKNYQYKTSISKVNIIYINKHFEERFTRELSWYCYVLSLTGIEFKDALEQFCKGHNIEIDEDITFEALKKKEYRERKKLKENLSKTVLSIRP